MSRRSSSSPGTSRLPATLLLLLVSAVTLFWLGVALFRRPIGDYGVETDFYGDIVYYSRAWMDGHPSLMNGFRGPVYYLAIGFLSRVFGDAFLVGKMLSALSAGLSLWLIARVLSRVWHPWIGLFGALVLAANVEFVHYAVRASTDLPYLALYLATLTLLFERGRNGESPESGGLHLPWRDWAGAGGLAALATMTRYNGLVLVPIAVAIALTLGPPFRRRFTVLAGFLAAFVVTMAPWSLFLWSRTGSPLWNNNFKNVAIDVYVSHPGIAQAGRFIGAIDFTSIGEVYRTAPSRFLETMTSNLWTHFRGDAVELIGLPWAAVSILGWTFGAMILFRNRERLDRAVIAFAATGLLSFAALVPAFYNARFMLSLLPFWAAGVGILADSIGRRASGFRAKGRSSSQVSPPRHSGGVLLLVVLTGLVGRTQWGQLQTLADPEGGGASPVELLDLASKAKLSGFRFDSGTPVAARKPHLGYYLGVPTVSLVPGSLEQIRESGAHYLLVSGAEATWSGALVSLIFPQSPGEVPPGLSVVAQTYLALPDGRARSGTLYAIQNPIPYEPPPLLQHASKGTTIAGLDRLDTLRLRIVRWIHFWDRRGDSHDLIAQISQPDHPQVLLARGDRALMDHDAAAARSLYDRALPELEDPEEGILRLAAVGMLTGDDALVDEQYSRVRLADRGPGELRATDWLDIANRYRSLGDPVGSLAPIAFALSQAPEDPRTFRSFALALVRIGWSERGRPLLERYLETYPDDDEVREALGSITHG